MHRKTTSLLAGFAAICVVLSAVAATYSVTLKSSQPVSEQANALSNYIAQLPVEKQGDMVEALESIALDYNTGYSEGAKVPGADTVYISGQGERYHITNTCRGLKFANNVSGITKEAAIEIGKTPCKICYPTGDDN